jgi:hypothetical protein
MPKGLSRYSQRSRSGERAARAGRARVRRRQRHRRERGKVVLGFIGLRRLVMLLDFLV